jgi:carbonic anhydrase
VLAVLTCIDPRLDPLAILGLEVGEAAIVRTPGARVTDETLATLVLARWVLGVERVLVVAHTDCQVTGRSEDDIRTAIRDAGGPDTSALRFSVARDDGADLSADVARLRAEVGVPVESYVYDVVTAELNPADPAGR